MLLGFSRIWLTAMVGASQEEEACLTPWEAGGTARGEKMLALRLERMLEELQTAGKEESLSQGWRRKKT